MSVPWYLMAKGKGGGGYKTASGPIVSVNDALAAPLRSLVANIEPVQSGSGDPSPDNVRPISGWSEVNVTRTGKNLLPNTPGRNSAGGLDISVDSTTKKLVIDGTNTNTSYTGGGITKDNARYKLKAGTYTLSIDQLPTTTAGSYLNMEMFTPDGARTQKVIYGNAANKYTTFTISADVVFDWWMSIGAGTYNNLQCGIQLELGSTATAYAPYSGNQYTLQLGQTVYGGTLDVTTGVLTVDRAIVDLGDINWSVDPNRPGVFYGAISGRLSASFISMCSEYEVYNDYVTISKDAYISGRASYGANMIFVRDTRYATLTGAKYKVASAGITAVYPLATPITIPLTPTQISTLQGQNNVWGDCGDVTVEYLSAGGADPDLMKLAVAFMGRK